MRNTFNFNNIGGKIKNLAQWTCWITIVLVWIGDAISFFVFLDSWSPEICLLPLAGAAIAPFLIWISFWPLYGFGELIERSGEIASNTRGEIHKSNTQTRVDSERIQKLERLRAKNLITEEEYQAALAKQQ